MDVYQLKIALRGISPMVWRRLKVAGNTDLGDLHTIIQLAMGWKDYHLHTFRIWGFADIGVVKLTIPKPHNRSTVTSLYYYRLWEHSCLCRVRHKHECSCNPNLLP
jgi:hypothetical protein